MTLHEKWVVLGLLLALLLGVAVRTYRRGHPFSTTPSLNSEAVVP